jgi:hypothetical protein
MQKHLRRFLAQRKIVKYRAAVIKATHSIQSVVRGWLARKDNRRMLWDKETAERRHLMQILLSHSRYEEATYDDISKVRACGRLLRLLRLIIHMASSIPRFARRLTLREGVIGRKLR